MSSLRIRECEAADADRLDWSPHQHYRDHFERQFARQQHGETLVLVAEDASGLVGRVIINFSEGEADEAWVYALGVQEHHRRQGVATALMHTAAEAARHRGATSLCLTVEKTNRTAMAFYDRLGFVRTGEDVSAGLKDQEGRVIDEPAPRWILQWRLATATVAS
jgi:ribosomal protein S18 acetylase RimI-like enzyme